MLVDSILEITTPDGQTVVNKDQINEFCIKSIDYSIYVFILLRMPNKASFFVEIPDFWAWADNLGR